MKVALLEVSHWHFPLYIEALKRLELDIVGVSDREGFRGEEVAEYFSCSLYKDYRDLLETRDIDFAFAFGRHVEMRRIGEDLIERRVPFAMEKPCGINYFEVAALREKANAVGLYVAVPFIFRLSDLLRKIETIEGALPAEFGHFSVRFIAGSPSRYAKNGCSWMLEPAVSGGGCSINLAGHFIDLFLLLTGSNV